MSSKVFITKSSAAKDWGFDFTIAKVSNEPNSSIPSTILEITKVSDGSPAHRKVFVGDRISDIAGNSTIDVSVKDANDLIGKLGNSLFLTVCRSQAIESQQTIGTKGELNDDDVKAANSNTSNSIVTSNYQPTLTQKKTKIITSLDLPETHEAIPNAPIFSEDAIKSVPKYQSSSRFDDKQSSNITSSDDTQQLAYIDQHIPEKLRPSMNKPGMKPFTYTPRGVDLEEIMQKARLRQVNRQMQHSTGSYTDDQRISTPNATSDEYPEAQIRSVSSMRSLFTGETETAPIQQSKSFHRLRGWVKDNATSQSPIPVDDSQPHSSRSAVAMAVVLDEQGEFDRSNQTIPSNAFRYLQKSCDTMKPSTEPSVVSAPIPISDNRFRQTVLKKESINYSGSNQVNPTQTNLAEHQPSSIPSRSFRQLKQFEQVPPYTEQSVHPYQTTSTDDYDPSRLAHVPRAHATTIPSRSFKYLQSKSGTDNYGNELNVQNHSVMPSPSAVRTITSTFVGNPQLSKYSSQYSNF